MFRKILLALSIVTVFFAQELRANPLDTFGLTSANIAMGGGATGTADSYDAVWYNPAGLGQLDGFDFGLGTLIYRPFLKATT
ncbi:long-chain fatty acid transporter, partial [Myxococcota bacterium]|nr:long-chain fatty acid transporter [Myxococcota bacterium]